MSQRSLEKLSDWAIWYAENKDRSTGDLKIEFLTRAVDELGAIAADLLGDIAELEGMPRERLGRRLLYTPTGITARGDMRKFG
jgi:hypothetical protein